MMIESATPAIQPAWPRPSVPLVSTMKVKKKRPMMIAGKPFITSIVKETKAAARRPAYSFR
jgi:hypothetical protein